MDQDHANLHRVRRCPSIDHLCNAALLADVVGRTVGAQILFRSHPLLVGTRLDACCLADDRHSFVVFYRADLAPEQATRIQLEVLGRILLGQVASGAPVCYSLCRGTPFADALLTANLAPQRLAPVLSRWMHGFMGMGQASPTEW